MNFWRFCFILNIVFYLSRVLEIALLVHPDIDYSEFQNSVFYKLLLFILFTPTIALWMYTIYFWRKFDRYSTAIFKILFIPFYYTWYYYDAIWKERRELDNVAGPDEPVLGRSIHLETDDEEGKQETYPNST